MLQTRSVVRGRQATESTSSANIDDTTAVVLEDGCIAMPFVRIRLKTTVFYSACETTVSPSGAITGLRAPLAKTLTSASGHAALFWFGCRRIAFSTTFVRVVMEVEAHEHVVFTSTDERINTDGRNDVFMRDNTKIHALSAHIGLANRLESK